MVIGTIIIATVALRTVFSLFKEETAMSATTAPTARGPTTPPGRRRQQRGHHASRRAPAARPSLAWVVGLLFVLPVLWMVLTSFHNETDAATNPPVVFAPLTLDGYRSFFAAGPWPPLLNSLTASVLSTLLVLLLAFPAAYALSIRPVKKWTDVLFFFLSTKMLPIVAGHPAALPVRAEGAACSTTSGCWSSSTRR